MVTQEPFAFLDGGEEGESRLNKIEYKKTNKVWVVIDIVASSNSSKRRTYNAYVHVLFLSRKQPNKSHLLVFPLPACASRSWPLPANTEYSREGR